MGVLAGIEDATGLDLRQCESFVGTSAGSIVAAQLVAGNSPRRPVVGRQPSSRSASAGPARGLASAGAVATARRPDRAGRQSPFAPLALGAPRPAAPWCASLLLRALPRPADDARRRCARRSSVRAPGSTAGCGSPPSIAARPPGRVRQPRRAGRHRRRGGRGVLHGAVAVRAGDDRRRASTSTAASGARPTSTPRPPAATRTCCA